ncbi:MAG: 3'-5' exonuclease, partial [Polyangiaceae bacterium]
MASRAVEAFLLSREWRDRPDGVEIVLWGRAAEGPVCARIPAQEAVMFVPRHVTTSAGRRRPRPLRSLAGEPVDAVYFRSQRALVEERDRLRSVLGVALESDVKPADRYLMERFVTASFRLEGEAVERRGVLWFDSPRVKAAELRPELSLLALDLETDGWDGPLLSAAIATRGREKVIVRAPRPVSGQGPGPGSGAPGVILVPDERALLTALFAEIAAIDPDVVCGWNVVAFDLAVLEARCRASGVPFALGRAGELARVMPAATAQQV